MERGPAPVAAGRRPRGPGGPTPMSVPTQGRDVRAVLEGLSALEGVRGALLVAPDGLVIAAHLPDDIGVEALSALAATLGRELELRAGLPGHGAFAAARFGADIG